MYDHVRILKVLSEAASPFSGVVKVLVDQAQHLAPVEKLGPKFQQGFAASC